MAPLKDLDSCRPTTHHHKSALKVLWGLKSDCYPGWRGFQFIIPFLNSLTTVQWAETSSMSRMKCLCSSPSPALKG